MPIYEHFCFDCEQEFTHMRAMSQYKEPAPCPSCGVSCDRVTFSAPRSALLSPQARIAHQRNEKSAHEPRMSRGHVCGAACNHNHSSKTEEKTPQLKQQLGKGRRPWMLGH